MLRNYFKIAWRNLRKQKFYSAINIMGLTVGMTCCFLIFMYVRFELSYDTFHRNASRIYRVVTDVKTPTETIVSGITSGPMAPNLKADFPEVLQITRVNMNEALLEHNDNKYQEKRVIFADSTFFKLFTFPLLKGDAATALVAPMSVVLSEKTAKKYFGNTDPMGQSLRMEGKESLTVTGVMKDVPENSHLPFDVAISMTTMRKVYDPRVDSQWGNFGMMTYALLPENADPQRLERKLPAFMEKHVGRQMKESNMYYTLRLEPLKDIYLRSERPAPVQGRIANVYIFSAVAVFVLLIACINFVNLATARATERAREVGVRKSVGAYDRQLMFQFLSETLLLSMISFVLSLLLCQLLLPAFNTLAGKEVRHFIFADLAETGYFLLIAIAVGLLAGIYPALVLSSYRPVTVLKGAFSSSTKGLALRKGLVVFQFVVTIVLIAGVMIVYHQLSYLQHRQLGFKKEQTLVLDFGGIDGMSRKWPVIKREVLQQPGVISATFSSAVPGAGQNSAYTNLENRNGEMQASNINVYFVDFDFIRNYGIKIVAGRGLSGSMATDSTKAMLVNEAVVHSMGYTKPADIIGKRYSQWGSEGVVVGVFRNFNYRSLRQGVEPLSMRIWTDPFNTLSVRVSTTNIPQTIAALERVFNRFAPERRFSYFFLDEFFNRQYQDDYRFGRLVLFFAALTVFLAALGLLGLISYIVIQRTREIGIRKVLGASVPSIVFLLSGDFLKLVLVALLLATPLAWYAMHRWLQDFAYRTPIQWWVFALAGMLALVVALATVSLQTVKAAFANPVKALKTE